MARVALVGSDGALHRRLVERLAGAGHEAVNDGGRSTGPLPPDCAAVISTGAASPAAVVAAASSGIPYLDPHYLDPWVEEVEVTAERLGGLALPGVGVVGTLGVHLAAIAAGTLEGPAAVHITHAVPRLLTAGQRLAFLDGLSSRGRVIVEGESRREAAGEVTRAAYMPRPTGPRRALSFPSAEPDRIASRLLGLREVRAYAVLPGPLAVTQPLLRAASRRPGPRRALRGALLAGGRLHPGTGGAAGGRWVVLAEVSGRGRTARAWAEGRDVHDATAAILVARLEGLLETGAERSVTGPSDEVVLDALGRSAGVRWVLRPPPSHGTETAQRPEGWSDRP